MLHGSFRAKLDAPGPKKLLAIEGGGLRGTIAIEFLAKIESELREALQAPDDFVLADYFDYVAGTSTGAILAAAIALGLSATALRELFEKHGAQMFETARLRDRLKYRYSADQLKHILQERMGADTELGSERLRTLLLLVMRNATTDSPWPLTNNPRAKYNDESLPDCNLRLPLWQLVRASTAAPAFFPPEEIVIGTQRFIFADGAVTTYNNPAFLLFLMATLEPYGLCWPASEEELLLVSVGTGVVTAADEKLRPAQMNLIYHAESVPAALIAAATNEQDMLCRVFGAARAGAPLDSEIGDLIGTRGPTAKKLFTYARYNVDLSEHGLADLGLSHIAAAHVRGLDSVGHVPALAEVGARAAERYVSAAHFAGFLGGLARPDELERPVAL
jgi:patatin-like phospholipase/acyl hydrolase